MSIRGNKGTLLNIDDRELLRKKNEEFIKRQDRRENVERMNRIQEYQRDLLMVKIGKEYERLDEIKQEKA